MSARLMTERVEILEQKVEALPMLPDRVADRTRRFCNFEAKDALSFLRSRTASAQSASARYLRNLE